MGTRTGMEILESLAMDGTLMREAREVYNETGLTPRQLDGIRKRSATMIEAIKWQIERSEAGVA